MTEKNTWKWSFNEEMLFVHTRSHINCTVLFLSWSVSGGWKPQCWADWISYELSGIYKHSTLLKSSQPWSLVKSNPFCHNDRNFNRENVFLVPNTTTTRTQIFSKKIVLSKGKAWVRSVPGFFRDFPSIQRFWWQSRDLPNLLGLKVENEISRDQSWSIQYVPLCIIL